METSNLGSLVDRTGDWNLETAQKLWFALHMVECSQSTRYILDTAASSKPNIPTFCKPGTVDIPREAVQIGDHMPAGSRPRQGRQGLWSTSSGPRWWPTSTSTANNTHDLDGHKRPRLAARAGQGGHGQGRGQALVSKPSCSSRRFRQHCLPFHPGLGCHPTPVPTARLSHQTPAFPPKSFPQREQPCPVLVC